MQSHPDPISEVPVTVVAHTSATDSSPEGLLGRGSQGSSSPLPWAGGASGHLTLLRMTRGGEKWGWSRGQDTLSAGKVDLGQRESHVRDPETEQMA